jgi:hypothetical protein
MSIGLFRRTDAPPRIPDRGGPWGEAIVSGLRGAYPWLQDVEVGAPGSAGGPASWGDPINWPDGGEPRWFYYPRPLPPGVGRPGSELSPHLFGHDQGRVWAVNFQYLSNGDAHRRAMVRFRTFARAVPTGQEASAPPPWGVVSPPLDAPMFRFAPSVTITPRRGVATYALQALLLSGVQQGRASRIPGEQIPGIPGPTAIASSDPRVDGFLRSSRVVGAYAGWVALGGGPSGNPVPVRPIVDLHGLRIQVWAPLAPDAPPSAVAEAFGAFRAMVTALESQGSGAPSLPNADEVALPTPPNAVPDLRPGVRCPRCGQIETVRNRSDPTTHVFRVETLQCAQPVFGPPLA